MKLQDLKGKLKVGMRVKETRDGDESLCDELRDGKEATITKIDEYGVFFNDCFHYWTRDIDLVPPKKDWDNLVVGDTIVNKSGDEFKILEVGASGKTFLASLCKNSSSDWDTMVASWYHIEQAKRYGWEIKEAETETTELTVREVAEKLNISPDKLKIVDK